MRNLFILALIATSSAAFGSTAMFSADKTSGCPPLVVNFTDQSTIGPTSWLWDFGNGNTSTLQNPAATFLNPGTYTVKLVATNGAQSDSSYSTIRVFKLPVVDFTVSDTVACLTDTVTFLSNVAPGDAPITQYAWGFGNGVANNNPVARYRYNFTGVYDITLVVQDSNGCSANKTRDQYIRVAPTPIAGFTASPYVSCNATQTVYFTNTSTGNGLTYQWTLDGGVTSTLQNPSYTYTQEKTTVMLLVTDVNGCKSAASSPISVTEIIANFAAAKTLLCTGEKDQFANTSNFAGTTWFWDFGDGTTSTAYSPYKTYSSPGTYTVKFVVYNGPCGDSLTKTNYITVVPGFSVNTPTFGTDSTISCGAPLNVNFTNTTPGSGDTYSWNFSNGDTSNLENPNETFASGGNYSVTLTVTDTNGCSITGIYTNIIQTGKPVAKFNADTFACPGAPVQFYNQSTGASSYIWYFGDGDSSTAQSPGHYYAQEGSYTVTLVAINSAGCDTTLTKPNYMHIDTVHVDFAVNSTFSPCPPFVAEFSNHSGRNISKYLWLFGDGFTDTASNPTHIFFYPGVYTVKLIGYTSLGCTDTVTYPNLITVQGPTGQFTVTPTTGCSPLQVSFSATTSVTTKSIWCDLGDGNVINDSTQFVHTYNGVRVFHPQFVLTDFVGCSVSFPLDSIITRGGTALQVNDTTICGGQQVKVNLSSSESYAWSPATYLSCATCASVVISTPDSITYQITSTDKTTGCVGNTTLHVNVAPAPVLNDSLSPSVCPDDVLNLYVGDAAQITWSPATYLSNPNSTNPICTPPTSITYTVTAANSAGCISTVQVPVTVKDKIDVTLADNANVCEGGNIQLQSSINISADSIQYTWSPAQYLNNAGIANPVATLNNEDVTFQVTVSSGHCMPGTATIKVTVSPMPTISVSPTLVTTPYGEGQLIASSNQELSYVWSTADSLSCFNCQETNIYPANSGVVYVSGLSKAGCVVTDSIAIDVVGCDGNAIFMANTFTPNGDGLNDKFYIHSKVLASLKYFRVYNEWGEMVFETHDMSEGWDGTAFGKPAAIGVYVYELEGKCYSGYDVKKSGSIAAIR